MAWTLSLNDDGVACYSSAIEVSMHKNVLIILVLSFLLLFTACQREDKGSEAEATRIPLKVGMMSAVDAAPFYVAQDNGYSEALGIDVQLILFTNGQHRQTALQTGQVDGAMTDLVALITQRDSNFRLVGTLSTDGDFPLLAKDDLQQKSEISAGTMEISVTNYLLEQYLQDEHTVKKVYINEIPARLEAVLSGQLDTGIFPEPFASIGALRGLKKIFYAGIPIESLNIIAFTEKATEEKTEALKKFHKAYEMAIDDILQNEDLARDALMKHIPNLPPEIRNTINVPQYQKPRLPSAQFIEHIMSWTSTVTKSNYAFDPSSIIDSRFIEAL